MRVFVESVLPCTPDAAWAEVQQSALLVEVASPLVAIRPTLGAVLPERWSQEQTARCRSYLLGIILLGTRTVYFERIDAAAREIQTREHDRWVRRWDHLIRIRAAAEGHCQYSDEIEIEAGWLTPLVWLFACCFYRHRQRRWRRVALRLPTSVS